MTKETALSKIKDKINFISNLERDQRFSPAFQKWHRDTRILLSKVFGEDSQAFQDFLAFNFKYKGIRVSGPGINSSEPDEKAYRRSLQKSAAILQSINEEIEEFGLTDSNQASPNPIHSIELFLYKFHSIVRQLRRRYSERPTLDVTDEYDVQDLLHAILRIYFNDIRTEEWTPSYAGNSSRMDFLLHDEEIVIETKMTRNTLKTSTLVDELLIDISRYEKHPGCKLLICCIYDPMGYIGNTSAIIKDLESKGNDFPIRFIINPLVN